MDSRLRLIEAALSESPYGMRSVLDSPSAAPARVPPSQACDRACTVRVMDGLLAAMMARDPSRAALAPGVRYTENGQPLQIGDGLWRTLTARGSYNLYLPAAADSDAALFASIVETDIPGHVSLRVRQRDGQITEIEALVVRQEIAMLGQLIGTGTLFAPPQLADFDAARFKAPPSALGAHADSPSATPVSELRSIATRYAESIYGGVGSAPVFSDRCTARENGVPAVLNRTMKPLPGSKPPFHPFQSSCAQRVERGFFAKIGRLREARVLAADESQGHVLLATTVDHAGIGGTVTLGDGTSVPVPPPFAVPNSHFSATLLEIRDGRIEHIETITRPVFLGMDDGWQN
jgi:hypothetical protein